MRSTFIEIDKDNLLHNLEIIKSQAPNSEILAVVKANAYGHGAINIAKNIQDAGVNYFGVAYAEEGAELRNSGITSNIVVMVPASDNDIDLILENNLEITVSSLEFAKIINKTAKSENKKVQTHLFVNTGMNRDGILPEKAKEFTSELSKLTNLYLKGILTHFASADSPDLSFTIEQNEKFRNLIQKLYLSGYEFEYNHAANSASIFQHSGTHYNMIRPGIALYGLMPDRRLGIKSGLKPVLQLKSKVLHINHLSKGDTAGYSFKFVADSETKVAIIPIGYGDGFSRLLSNKTSCIIKDKRYRIIGSICMDQLIVAIENDKVEVGDEVTLIGKDNGHEISVYDLADVLGTIPYEITTSLSKRIPILYK